MPPVCKAVSEIVKGNRRIENKVNGISIDFSEIKGTLIIDFREESPFMTGIVMV